MTWDLCKIKLRLNRGPLRYRPWRCIKSAKRKACFRRKSVSYLERGDEKKGKSQGAGYAERDKSDKSKKNSLRRHSGEQTIKIVKSRAHQFHDLSRRHETRDLWKSRCVFYQTHSTVAPLPRFEQAKENCLWKLLKRGTSMDDNDEVIVLRRRLRIPGWEILVVSPIARS